MTRDEILALPAGPDLDRLVAELVLGWTVGEVEIPHERDWRSEKEARRFAGGEPTTWMPSHEYEYVSSEMFRPSVDIRAAWEVVEQLRQRWYAWNPVRLSMTLSGWCCRIRVSATRYEVFNSQMAPHAICIAALLAVLPQF